MVFKNGDGVIIGCCFECVWFDRDQRPMGVLKGRRFYSCGNKNMRGDKVIHEREIGIPSCPMCSSRFYS